MNTPATFKFPGIGWRSTFPLTIPVFTQIDAAGMDLIGTVTLDSDPSLSDPNLLSKNIQDPALLTVRLTDPEILELSPAYQHVKQLISAGYLEAVFGHEHGFIFDLKVFVAPAPYIAQ